MTDLSGKVALITGASSGIGLEAAVKIARAGAEVVLVARDPERTAAAADEVRRRSGSAKVSFLLCDFGSQRQVRALGAAFRAGHDRLDLLVNNAGLVSDKLALGEDGVELTFAVNHLGYFLLTTLLLDLIRASAPARIVNVSSVGHRRWRAGFDDLNFERGGYSIMSAYGRSKLANVLFTRELARRLAGTGVTVNALHPGAVATGIWAKAPWYARPLLALAKRVVMITAEQGGDTLVYLATSDEVAGATGGYYQKNRLVAPSPRAQDDALAAELWTRSEQLVAGTA